MIALTELCKLLCEVTHGRIHLELVSFLMFFRRHGVAVSTLVIACALGFVITYNLRSKTFVSQMMIGSGLENGSVLTSLPDIKTYFLRCLQQPALTKVFARSMVSSIKQNKEGSERALAILLQELTGQNNYGENSEETLVDALSAYASSNMVDFATQNRTPLATMNHTMFYATPVGPAGWQITVQSKVKGVGDVLFSSFTNGTKDMIQKCNEVETNASTVFLKSTLERAQGAILASAKSISMDDSFSTSKAELRIEIQALDAAAKKLRNSNQPNDRNFFHADSSRDFSQFGSELGWITNEILRIRSIIGSIKSSEASEIQTRLDKVEMSNDLLKAQVSGFRNALDANRETVANYLGQTLSNSIRDVRGIAPPILDEQYFATQKILGKLDVVENFSLAWSAVGALLGLILGIGVGLIRDRRRNIPG